MKKILTIAASLAIVAGLASCQKENIIDNGGNGDNIKTGTITATFSKPTTKVIYSEVENESNWDLQPHWEKNDTIVGINSKNEAFELTVINVVGEVATLDVPSEYVSVCEGSVTLFYKTGLRAKDWDNTKKQFVVNLNGQKGNNTMPAIMKAIGTINAGTGKFTFNNSGAVLGISNVGDGLKGKTIKQVTLYGKNLASSATLKSDGVTFNDPNSGYNVISTEILSDITVKDNGDLRHNASDNHIILMAVPAGAQIDSVFIRTTEGEVYSLGSSNANKTLSANDYRYIKDATFVRDAKRDDMILTGVYSVKDGEQPVKQVFFSKGNLWADGDNALHFESNQYSYAGSGHVSYFTWSSTVEKAVGESNDGNFLFCNESNKQSVDGSGEIYYALSKDEWTYLFNNHSKKWVTVNGKNGYAIAPDGFTGTIAGPYADDAALAADNLVFLPAAGKNNGLLTNSNCYYWSSSWDYTRHAYGLSLNEVNLITDHSTFRNDQFSVRLVSECK